MPTPPRLVTLHAYKGMAILEMVNIYSLSVVRGACAADDCNWTQGIFFHEYCSGWFFLLNGVLTALSICHQLTPRSEGGGGSTWHRVVARQMLRSIFMVVLGIGAKAFERFADRLIFDWALPPTQGDMRRSMYIGEAELGEEALGPAPTNLSALLLQGLFAKRALIFHGACTALTSLLLLVLLRFHGACPTSGKLSPRIATWALALGVLVLLANPAVRRLADHTACCVHECDDGESGGEALTPVAKAGKPPPFRVPSGCTIVTGNGSGTSPFDPCAFTASGGLYLPMCEDAMHSEVNATCEQPAGTLRNCSDVASLACDGDGCPPPLRGRRASCDELAAHGACGELMATLDPSVTQSTDAAVVARHCELACTPQVCLNSPAHLAMLARLREATALLGSPEERTRYQELRKRALAKLADGKHRDEATGDGLDAAASAALRARVLACRREVGRLNGIGERTSHGLAEWELGRRWCPQLVTSQITYEPEAVAQTCKRVPWWGRSEEGLPLSLVSRLSGRQLVAAMGLQLLFGLHGVFAYLASSLAGAAIGVSIARDGGVQLRMLRWFGACCAVSLCVGLGVTMRLRAGGSSTGAATDSFLRSASHTRLVWGSFEGFAMLTKLYFVERHATRRANWDLHTRTIQRLGSMSLQVYLAHGVVAKMVYMPFDILCRRWGLSLVGGSWPASHGDGSEGAPSRTSYLEIGVLLTYLSTVLAFWHLALLVLERTGLAGRRTRTPQLHDQPKPGGQLLRPGQWWHEAADWAAAQAQLRLIFWAPPLVWSALATTLLAPSINDIYYRDGLASFWHSGSSGLPKLFPLLLSLHCIVPVAACAVLVGGVRVVVGGGKVTRNKSE